MRFSRVVQRATLVMGFATALGLALVPSQASTPSLQYDPGPDGVRVGWALGGQRLEILLEHHVNGSGRTARTTGPWSGWRGQVIERRDGDADRILTHPSSRWVAIQRVFRARQGPVREVMSIDTPRVRWSPEAPIRDRRVLAGDGLTPAERARTNYLVLVSGRLDDRESVVAGWLTHDRGSGIVRALPEEGRTVFQGLSEYGRLLVEPGTEVLGEAFVVGMGTQATELIEGYASAIGDFYHLRLPKIPNGHCTWYSQPNGGAASATAIRELADFCKRELAPFGFDTLQIDDQWQGRPRPQPNGGPASDFTRHDPQGPFPEGMRRTAEDVRAAGLRPGIWLLPFAWDPQCPSLASHRDWFVRQRETGDPYYVFWAGWCLDMTHPEARRFAGEAYRRIASDWGYSYLKLDGLWSGMATHILYPEPTYRSDGLGDAVFHNPRKPNVEAYRDGLRLVRQSTGRGTYLLGCCIAQNMRTLGASIGCVDGMRVGADTGADWNAILPGALMASRLYFLHNRVWHNDPDCLMLRSPLTLDMARSWASFIAISGQLNMVSEWLPGLPAERLDILKRSLPNTGLCGRPLDFLERDPACVWLLRDGRAKVERNVIGLFNWNAKGTVTLPLSTQRAGLAEGDYVGFDFWANELVPPFHGDAEFRLPPASCKVVALRRLQDHPLVVSTSRHITQGLVDLEQETWQPSRRVLRGRSRLVANDPYELRVYCPAGWKTQSVAVRPMSGRRDVTAAQTQEASLCRVTLSSSQSGVVDWVISFEPRS